MRDRTRQRDPRAYFAAAASCAAPVPPHPAPKTWTSMLNQAIFSEQLAPPIGAYSQAIRAGSLLFISGQVALDDQGQVVGAGDMETQARAVFRNLETVLAAAGATPEHVAQLTIYVTDMTQRAAVSQARRAFVREPFPASSLVGVSALAHPDLLIEVEAIAVVDPAGSADHDPIADLDRGASRSDDRGEGDG